MSDTSPVPMPPEMQSAFDTASNSLAAATASDADNKAAQDALAAAETTAASAAGASLAAHQQATADGNTFLAAVKTFFGLS